MNSTSLILDTEIHSPQFFRIGNNVTVNYQFINKPNSIAVAIDNLKKSLAKSYWTIEKIINSRIVKPFSPKSDLVVIDSIIKPLN